MLRASGETPGSAEMSEFRLRIIMQRPASPFVAVNLVKYIMWLSASTYPWVGQIADYVLWADVSITAVSTRRLFAHASATLSGPCFRHRGGGQHRRRRCWVAESGCSCLSTRRRWPARAPVGSLHGRLDRQPDHSFCAGRSQRLTDEQYPPPPPFAPSRRQRRRPRSPHKIKSCNTRAAAIWGICRAGFRRPSIRQHTAPRRNDAVATHA
jgi:hypothetical protein